VGAMVGLIVQVRPAMAYAIFGIGGLLRFRTDVGEAKDTGRVILVTVVGVCCGLKIFIVAIPATLLGWALIFALERRAHDIISVAGVSEEKTHESIDVYQSLIERFGCQVVGIETHLNKHKFTFIVSAPAVFDRASVEAHFGAISPDIRGVVDWEQART